MHLNADDVRELGAVMLRLVDLCKKVEILI